jgi:hypothetical protein
MYAQRRCMVEGAQTELADLGRGGHDDTDLVSSQKHAAAPNRALIPETNTD